MPTAESPTDVGGGPAVDPVSTLDPTDAHDIWAHRNVGELGGHEELVGGLTLDIYDRDRCEEVGGRRSWRKGGRNIVCSK